MSVTKIPSACGPFEEDLSALIDRELPEARAAEVQAHVAACSVCAARLEALRRADAALRALAVHAVPDGLEARLRDRIAAQRSTRTPARRAPPRRSRALRLSVAAAAAAAVLAAVVLVPRLLEEAPTLETRAPGFVQSVEAAAPETGEIEVDVVLASASEEELAIALEIELLEDLDLIERLDLLERLGELEGREAG